jgi:hypothetical protein
VQPMPVTRRPTSLARRTIVRGALPAAALGLLAGCSSNTPQPSATSHTTTTVTPATVATTIPFSLAKNARQDVTTPTPCRHSGGAWVLAGTIKNSAKVSRSYQIVVDFVTLTGNTVLDTRVITTPPVRAGAVMNWSAKSTPGLPHVACVIRQVQAPA